MALEIIIVAVIGILFSTFQVLQHLFNYYNAKMQRYVVRLLLMVPIYLLFTLLQIYTFTEARLIRDCYEGFIVYSFFSLVNQYIGEDETVRNLLKSKSKSVFPPPLCFWKCDPTVDGFLEFTKIGVLQYVVVRITTTFLGLMLDFLQKDAKILLVINGTGMSIAMFTLVNYYIVVRHDIERFRPVLQFFSVKFVIFLGFYQELLLKSSGLENSKEIENLLTAVEMLIASIIHIKAFHYKIFTSSFEEAKSFTDAVRDAFNWLDLKRDFQLLWEFMTVSQSASTINNRGRGFKRVSSEEWQDQPLINVTADEISQGLLDLRG